MRKLYIRFKSKSKRVKIERISLKVSHSEDRNDDLLL